MVAGRGLGPEQGLSDSSGLLEQMGKTGLEAGKVAEGAIWAPTPQSFLLVIHPLPHSLVVFTQFFCFPSFLQSQTAGVAGAQGGGFRWLAAFGGFSKPQTLPRPPEF